MPICGAFENKYKKGAMLQCFGKLSLRTCELFVGVGEIEGYKGNK